MSKRGEHGWHAIVTALILLVTLQALLIYLGHFSSFDREMNWLSVFAGARPAPVFWGAALADYAALRAAGLLPEWSGNHVLAGALYGFFPGLRPLPGQRGLLAV